MNVGIADLKSRLSEFLRRVRRGQSLTVFDRDTPVARIVPYEAARSELIVRPPDARSSGPGTVKLPRPIRTRVDAVELLLDDRRRRS